MVRLVHGPGAMRNRFVAVVWMRARTLRQLARGDRAALVAATLGAGRLLADAHRRGLVHGGFSIDHAGVDDADRPWLRPAPPSAGGAPEVLHGGAPTAAADQFSFAAAVIELWPPSLTGRAAVREALLRALSVDPAGRWPGLDALLDALASGARRRWWPWRS